MSSQVIADALLAYDKAKPVIGWLRMHTKLEFIASNSDLTHGKLVFRHKETNEVVLETEFEYMAAYYGGYGVFIWSWAQAHLTRPYIYLTRKALDYALNLEADKVYIKSLLTLSRGSISHPIQVDINIALCAYLIKRPYIYAISTDAGGHPLLRYAVLLNTEGIKQLESHIQG